MNVAGRMLIDGSHLNVQPKSSTSSGTLVFDQSMSSEFGSDSHGINVYGRQGGNSHLKFYNGRSGSVCNVLIDGNLDVGVGAASSLVKAHVNHAGSAGHIQMEATCRNQSFLSFGTTYVNGYIYSLQLRMLITCIVVVTSHIFINRHLMLQMTDLKKRGIDRKCL